MPGPYLGSYFSLAGSLAALILGGQALWQNPRSPLHRAFAAFAFTIALWEGGFVIVNAGTELDTVWLAYRVASVGFCLVPAAATALVLRLCEVHRPWRFLVPLVVVGLIFAARSWTGVLYVKDFVLTSGGNGYLHATDSPWYWAFNLTYLVHAANLVLLVRRWATVPDRRRRRQAAVLTLSYLATTTLHLAQSSVSSMMGVTMPWLITVLPANPLVLAAQAWAMARYRFLGLDAAWVDQQILRAVSDSVARFGADRKPYWTNQAWDRRFGGSIPSFLASWRPEGPHEGQADGLQWSVLSGSVALVLRDRNGEGFTRFGLNAEEADLAQWASDGLTNKEIAARLGLSEGTVKNKMSQVLVKLGAKNRSGLRRRLG